MSDRELLAEAVAWIRRLAVDQITMVEAARIVDGARAFLARLEATPPRAEVPTPAREEVGRRPKPLSERVLCDALADIHAAAQLAKAGVYGSAVGHVLGDIMERAAFALGPEWKAPRTMAEVLRSVRDAGGEPLK